MMSDSLVTVSYLVAAVLFILSLGGLSTQESAGRGNGLGIAGMLIALGITAASQLGSAGIMAGAIAGGALIGAVLALRVEMTSMPELVAVLHSFVGLAAVLVGVANYLGTPAQASSTETLIHQIEVFVGVFVGAVTFTGSIIAFGKLKGIIGSKPLLIPGRHAINAGMLAACIALAVPFLAADAGADLRSLLILAGVAGVLGIHIVMAIGGADMPVVVSMLNSYSGWAASAAGFMLGNDLLIVTGALVGSSGAILSIIMCRAMNRSFLSVILGGFGAEEGKAPAKRSGDEPAKGRCAPSPLRRPSSSCATRRASSSSPATAWPSRTPNTPSTRSRTSCAAAAARCALRFTPWPAASPVT